MKKIHRYLLKEFLVQFIFCTVGFLVIYIGELIFELNNFLVGRRVPLSVVMLLIYYRIPYLLMDIIPAAVLFGIFFGMGRLSKDRELDVMRTCGISFPRLVSPILIFTLLLSTGVFFFNDRVVPAANHRYHQEMRRLSLQEIAPQVEENVYFKGPDDRYFYVRRINGLEKRLEGVMIYEATTTAEFPRLITARYGWIDQTSWQLKEGVIHELDDRGFVKVEAGFAEMNVNVGEDLSAYLGDTRSTEEMTRAELKKHMELFGGSGFDVSVFEVDYHLKLAVPYASLVLAILGLPFSCLMPRSGRVLGMGISLAFIFTYYFSQVIFRTFGVNSIIDPFWAAWIPNLIYLTLGVVLLNRVIR
ncbi:MAG TPA: LptF/LptG family permease [Bacillota bacterium]